MAPVMEGEENGELVVGEEGARSYLFPAQNNCYALISIFVVN
jgi:hypothetical protein